MDLKVVCQKNEANEKNAPGPFIHCRGKTPGTNRLILIIVNYSITIIIVIMLHINWFRFNRCRILNSHYFATDDSA